MRMWQSVKNFFDISPRAKNAGKNRDLSQDAGQWDTWWQDSISQGYVRMDLFPIIEAPMVKYLGTYCDVANSDHLLIAIMAEYGLKSVLCAGNGLSQEGRALSLAGFDVTALDISAVATSMARNYAFRPDDMRVFGCGGPKPTSGRLDFVVGNLLDTTVCPGPFDVIIERRTVQRFSGQARIAALLALTGRLAKLGIFFSLSNDGGYFPSNRKRPFHAAELWFQEQAWTIWDGVPSTPLTGRVPQVPVLHLGGWQFLNSWEASPSRFCLSRRVGRSSSQGRVALSILRKFLLDDPARGEDASFAIHCGVKRRRYPTLSARKGGLLLSDAEKSGTSLWKRRPAPHHLQLRPEKKKRKTPSKSQNRKCGAHQ